MSSHNGSQLIDDHTDVSVAAPIDTDIATDDTEASATDGAPASRRARKRLGVVGVSVLMVIGLGALCGWLGWQVYRDHQTQHRRETFIQVARQSAINLTTIDWNHADDDVKRVLDTAAGTFADDFSQRAKPFIEVVKQARSKTEGKVTAAGLESSTDYDAQVLVAVSVKTSSAAAPEEVSRAWRMRMTVQNIGNDVKVANVEFVP